MVVKTTLVHSALTRSGTGKESFKLRRTAFIDVWCLTILPNPETNGTAERIDITMDERTATQLRLLLAHASL